MGSRAAMESRSGSRGRYYREGANQAEELTTGQAQKMVPEGVEGLVEYRGNVSQVINTLVGGIQAGLAHTGTGTAAGVLVRNRAALLLMLLFIGAGAISSFQKKAALWTQGVAGIAEGNPHGLADIRN